MRNALGDLPRLVRTVQESDQHEVRAGTFDVPEPQGRPPTPESLSGPEQADEYECENGEE